MLLWIGLFVEGDAFWIGLFVEGNGNGNGNQLGLDACVLFVEGDAFMDWILCGRGCFYRLNSLWKGMILWIGLFVEGDALLDWTPWVRGCFRESDALRCERDALYKGWIRIP